jgi:hypothetical protein
MVGFLGRGVIERSRSATEDLESNEVARGVGGDNKTSDSPSLYTARETLGDESFRDFEGVKWAANFEPRDNEGELVEGRVVGRGGGWEVDSDETGWESLL